MPLTNVEIKLPNKTLAKRLYALINLDLYSDN